MISCQSNHWHTHFAHFIFAIGLNPFNWTHHFFSFDAVAVKRYILTNADCIKRRLNTSYARCTHSLAALNRVFVCLRTENWTKRRSKTAAPTNEQTNKNFGKKSFKLKQELCIFLNQRWQKCECFMASHIV